MNNIARVISAVNMPVSTRMSLTAIRLRSRQNGQFSVFVENSPEAATLIAGDWIQVGRIHSDDTMAGFMVCDTPRTVMSNAAAPADVSNSVEVMVRTLPDAFRANLPVFTNQDCLAAFKAMDDARRDLQFSRHDGLLPDELLLDLLHGSPVQKVLVAHLRSRESGR
jgi:hypothetical protein